MWRWRTPPQPLNGHLFRLFETPSVEGLADGWRLESPPAALIAKNITFRYFPSLKKKKQSQHVCPSRFEDDKTLFSFSLYPKITAIQQLFGKVILHWAVQKVISHISDLSGVGLRLHCVLADSASSMGRGGHQGRPRLVPKERFPWWRDCVTKRADSAWLNEALPVCLLVWFSLHIPMQVLPLPYRQIHVINRSNSQTHFFDVGS